MRIPEISTSSLPHFRISDHDPNESPDAAPGRAYSLAQFMSELLTEIGQLLNELRKLRL
jgi:hypothetical protein